MRTGYVQDRRSTRDPAFPDTRSWVRTMNRDKPFRAKRQDAKRPRCKARKGYPDAGRCNQFDLSTSSGVRSAARDYVLVSVRTKKMPMEINCDW